MDPLHNMSGASFFGIGARQIWADVVLWEYFFNEADGLKAVIELGSGGHGLSVIFALHGVTRGFTVYTFDRRRYKSLDWPLPKLLKVEETFQAVDLFTARGQKAVLSLLARPELHPLLLFCDNGDKPREFAGFVPHLQPGDWAGVHDWDTEFLPADALVGVPLKPWRFALAGELDCISRIWEVQP